MGDQQKKRLKVAVIGTGISGMAAAWLLNARHDVTVYERSERIGGHSRTVDAPTGDTAIPVDTGFIVYNEKTYPNLTALFAHLDVPTEPSNMSFAVSLEGGRLEYSGTKLSALFAQKSNVLRPRFWSMLADIERFYREAPTDLTIICCRWPERSGPRRPRPCWPIRQRLLSVSTTIMDFCKYSTGRNGEPSPAAACPMWID
jgi:uncharacterized protein